MLSKGQDLPIFVTGLWNDVGGSLCGVWGQSDYGAFGDLDDMMKQIDESDEAIFKPVAINGIKVGDLVIAKYHDGAWYRAEVRSVGKEGPRCGVFFMDYGNEDTIAADHLVYGPPRYFEIQPIATKYILADVQPIDGRVFSQRELAVLAEHLDSNEFDAKVLHEGSSGVAPTLRLFEKGSDIPIVERIIQSGCGTVSENDHLSFPHIQQSKLPTDQSSQVYVAYSESALKFWLQLVTQEDALMELEGQLQDISTLSPIPPVHIKYGVVCIASFEETYYRGVVSAVDYSNKTATVTFIDYGNSANISFSELFMLPDKYCTMSAQAIDCSLSGSSVYNTDFDKLIESETVYARVLKVLESGLHIVDLSNDPVSAPYQPAAEKLLSPPPVFTSYLPMHLDDGVSVDVCISHVEENGQFYCQLLSKAKALDAMMCAVQEAARLPLKGAIKEGTCCLAQSPTDGIIYRAQIISGSVDGPHVKYVDFGMTETVRLSKLFHIPRDIVEIPARAACCSLSHSSDLTSEQIKQLLHKLNSKQPVVAEVVLKTSKSYDVVLYDTSVSDEPLVAVMSHKQSTARPATVIPSQPMKPRQSALQTPGFTSGSLELPNIALGQPVDIVGAVALGPTRFFAQFASFPVEDLEAFGEGLRDFYNHNDVASLPNCSAGDFCVAMFSEDKTYYRARVEARQGDIALVSFVDYGNQEKKNVRELKVLVPQFCKLPVAGAVFNIGKYHKSVKIEHLEQLIVEQELVVICDEIVKNDFVCKLPSVENNVPLLSAARPKQPEPVPRGEARTTATMQEKPALGSMNLAEGSTGQVLVSYVQDPENIVVQLLENKDDLDTLMDHIDEHCKRSAPNTYFQGYLGDLVIAKYSVDGGWYRAIISGVRNGGKQFEVYFVDYGNYDTVALNDLREITPKFTTLPAQGLKCRLNGIDEELSATMPWGPEHTDQLCNMIMDRQLNAHFLRKNISRNTFTVELIVDGRSANKKFLQACGRLSRRYEAVVPGDTQSKPEVTSHHTKVIAPKQVKLDTYVDFFIPYGLGIDKFWCQLYSDIVQLDEMQAAIAVDYATTNDIIQHPAPGMFCCALCSEDETWYRAEILSLDGDKAFVDFVDYGNQEMIPVSSLCVLKDKYYLLPRQTIQCELFGVEPVGKEWSQENNEVFLEMAMGVPKIVGCLLQKKDDGTYEIELAHADNKQMHEKLIRDGHARARIQHLDSATASSHQPVERNTSQNFKPVTLASNEAIGVYLSHVDGTGRIFCQLITEGTKLEALMAEIAANYSRLGQSDLRPMNIEVGTPCCAKYSQDGEWYRGEILEVASQKYRVRFVDYGDEEWVASDDIRQIIEPLLALPRQGIHIGLDNLMVITGKEALAKDLILEYTDSAVQLIPLSRTREGIYLSTILVNGKSLNDILIEAGVAAPGTSGPIAKRQETTASVPQVNPGIQPMIGRYKINRTVKVGRQYDVQVSWAVSPLEFYCQAAQSEATLVKLSEFMNEKYDGLKPNEMSLPNLEFGTACVAYYEVDGRWYRGSIQMVRGKQAIVKYVDYGNRSKVPLSHLKAPTADLLGHEIQAVQCSLKGIRKPVDGVWPESVENLFKELGTQELIMQIVSLNDDHYIVDLLTKSGRSLSEKTSLLMQKGGKGPRSYDSGHSKSDGQHEREMTNGSPEQSDYVERRDASKYGNPPRRPDERQMRNDIESKKLTRRGPETQVTPSVSASSSENLVYPQAVVTSNVQDCCIAFINSPVSFYVQVVSQEDEIATFAEHVLSEYSSLSLGERAVTKLSVNDPCCALFADDESWYRALVTDVRGNQATVLFVDYGNSSTVHLTELRALTKELASVPLYALECKLKDMHTYTEKDIEKFNELAVEKTFHVEFHTRSPPFEVSVFDGETNLLDLLPSGRLDAPKSYEPLPKPSDGAAYVSHIVSPGEFYVQFAEHEDQLAELAMETAPPTAPLSTAAVGTPCAAMFSEDQAWYRAAILSIDGPKALVQFVDHGNCEEVDVSALKEVPTLCPPLAVPCQVGIVKDWTEEDTAKFSELVAEKGLLVSLSGAGPSYVATLVDQETGKNVNEEFVSSELHVAPEQVRYEPLPKPSDGAAYVSHIVSPGEFYVQFAEHEDQLAELAMETAPPTAPLSTAAVGTPCAAMFSEDQAWYRAAILSIDGPKALVQFVDHGNCEEVDVSALKEVPTLCPPLAVPCQVGIVKDWTEEDTAKFSELVAEKGLHVSLSGAGPSYVATLVDQETGKNVNEEFVEDQKLPAETVAQSIEEDMYTYPPVDYSNISDEKQVFVSHVESPAMFYVQLVNMESDLNDLLDSLEEKYSSEACEVIKQPRVGMACCAKCTEDGVFYRAKIIDIMDGAVTVQFVDYGNCDTPPAENIFHMKPDRAPMVIPCCLANLVQPENGWTEDIIVKLQEITVDKVLTAKFHTIGDLCKVSLYEQKLNIATSLQEAFHEIQCAETVPSESAQGEVPEASVQEESLAATIEPREGEKEVSGFKRLPCPPQTIDMHISAVSSPREFYVQPQYIDDDINAMDEMLLDFYEDSVPLDVSEIIPGKVCLGKSEDGGCYRATIRECNHEENTAIVYFVDHGNSEKLKMDDLKKLHGDVLSQPAMAIECQLAGFQDDDFEWTQDEIDLFMEETQEKLLSMTMVDALTNPYTVSLQMEGEDIAHKLFANRLKANDKAVSMPTSASSAEETKQPALATAEKACIEREPCVVPEEVDEPLSEYEGVMPDENQNDEENVNEEKQNVASAEGCLPAAYKLVCGEKVPVSVSWVSSPSEFFIQLSSKGEELAEMEERLQSFCCDETEERELDPLEAGVICAAKYGVNEEDQKWYRVRILTVTQETDTVEVFFLDWGNSETVCLSLLRPLGEEFLKLAPQCVTCGLSNVQPITDEWPDEASAWFEETVTACESLMCVAIQHTASSSCEVQLFDPTGSSMADLLKQNGHAIEITEVEEEEGPKFVTDVPTATLNKEETQVCVSHLESPDNFWVQVKPNAVLEQLESDMMAFYTTSCPPAAADIQPGKCYAIQNEESWDRARVKTVMDHDVSVMYVDYGYDDVVGREYVYPLSSAFGTSVLSFQCRLVGVQPKGEQWSDESTELMRELTDDKCLLLQVVHRSDDTKDGKTGVRLLDMGIPVSQVLVDNNMAELVDIQEQGKVDLSESIVEYIDEVIASARAVAEQHEGKSLEEVATAELIDVAYLHGESPDKFHVQLSDGKDELKQRIEECFKQLEQDDSMVMKEDDNVLVFAEDQYYRAAVLSVQDDHVEVCLVDYGRILMAPKVNVRILSPAMKEEVFQLPSQCMACRLEGIESSQWTTQAMEFFEGVVRDQRLTVRILSQNEGDVYSVYMYVVSMSDGDARKEGCSVNMQLVQGGHATVIPGCQLDIDLDLETTDNAQQENSFLEETMLHSNSLGSLEDQSLYEAGTKENTAVSFTPLQYNVGDEVRMRVSSMEDLDNIILIDCMDTETFAILTEQMQEYYIGDGVMISSPVQGQPAAVLHAGSWQRCELINVEEGHTVEVLLVDTGLQQSVQRENLRILETRFCTLPTQAQRMSLNVDTETCSQEVIEKLKEACGVGEANVTVTVTIVNDSDDLLVADIRSSDGVELSSLCQDNADAADQPASIQTQDEEELQYATVIPSRTMTAGDKVTVNVTWVESPHKFWCQLQPSDAARLSKQMQATYSSDATEHALSCDTVVEGSVYAALMPTAENHEQWSRGVVLGSCDDVLSVQCCDTGRVATVPRQSLRRLTQQLAAKERFAVLCQTPGVLPPDGELGEWPAACIDTLEQYSEPLIMTVTELPSDDSPIHVTLTTTPDMVDVRQGLIQLQLAKPIAQLERESKSYDAVETAKEVDSGCDMKKDDKEGSIGEVIEQHGDTEVLICPSEGESEVLICPSERETEVLICPSEGETEIFIEEEASIVETPFETPENQSVASSDESQLQSGSLSEEPSYTTMSLSEEPSYTTVSLCEEKEAEQDDAQSSVSGESVESNLADRGENLMEENTGEDKQNTETENCGHDLGGNGGGQGIKEDINSLADMDGKQIYIVEDLNNNLDVKETSESSDKAGHTDKVNYSDAAEFCRDEGASREMLDDPMEENVLLKEDMEGLSNDDSKEIDTSSTPEVLGDRSQQDSLEDPCCEASDFHELEGTQLAERSLRAIRPTQGNTSLGDCICMQTHVCSEKGDGILFEKSIDLQTLKMLGPQPSPKRKGTSADHETNETPFGQDLTKFKIPSIVVKLCSSEDEEDLIVDDSENCDDVYLSSSFSTSLVEEGEKDANSDESDYLTTADIAKVKVEGDEQQLDEGTDRIG